MSGTNSALCELLPWDTEFFCCRIARVCGDTLKQEQAVQIDEWSRNNHIRGLYFLSRADDPATIQSAEQHGFGLVDIRVTLERGVMDSHDSTRPALPTGASIRPVQPDDLPGLQAMARTELRGTRFYNDLHFPRQCLLLRLAFRVPLDRAFVRPRRAFGKAKRGCRHRCRGWWNRCWRDSGRSIRTPSCESTSG